MTHLDAYLEPCPGFGWSGSPSARTTVVSLKNQRSRRNAEASQRTWRFTLPFSSAEIESYYQMDDLHAVARGRLHAFRVRNHLRYRAVNQLFGYGDGVTTDFQLGRLITVGGLSHLAEVHALSLDPDAPAPSVKASGVSAAATFSDRLAMVRFSVAPADGAPLTGTFWWDHWMYFAADDLPAEIVDNENGDPITNVQVDLEEAPPPNEAPVFA